MVTNGQRLAVVVPTGLKDPHGLLARRLQLAHSRAANAAGDTQQAVLLLQAVAEGLAADGSDEERGVMQLLLGDAQYQVSRHRQDGRQHHGACWTWTCTYTSPAQMPART